MSYILDGHNLLTEIRIFLIISTKYERDTNLRTAKFVLRRFVIGSYFVGISIECKLIPIMIIDQIVHVVKPEKVNS